MALAPPPRPPRPGVLLPRPGDLLLDLLSAALTLPAADFLSGAAGAAERAPAAEDLLLDLTGGAQPLPRPRPRPLNMAEP